MESNLSENSKGSVEHNCNQTITCKDCLDVLNEVIDNEQHPTDAFKQHLKDCLPCLEKYNLDKAIKEVLQKKCNKGTPPEDLVQNIKQRIINEANR